MSRVFKSSLAGLNARLLADAMVKIKAGTAKIVCVGDSMTYGQDAFSADKVAPVAPHVQSRVPVPYPEKLAAALNSAYSVAGITVENRGFSGDTAKLCYGRWLENPVADVAFIMLGINDAASPGRATLNEFSRYMALLVERYNAWGCGVVVMVATSMSQGNESRNVDPYRAAAVAVAKRYSCPVFQADQIGIHNNKTVVYSDSVHFNTAGYGLLGNSVAAFVIAGGLGESAHKVAEEKTFLTGTEFGVATNGSYTHGAGAFISQELILTLAKGTSQKATFAFYLDADAAEVSVSGIVSKNCAIEFDMDSVRSVATRKSVSAETSSNYTILGNDIRMAPANDIYLGRFVGRGWHSLSIGAPSGDSTQNAYLSAIKVVPVGQVEAVESVMQGRVRAFSVFDPPVRHGELPAASGATVFNLPKSFFGGLTVARTTHGYYQSAFALISIRSIGGGVSFTRYMLVADSATTFAVVLLSSVGANPVTIVSVAGAVQDKDGADLTVTLNRPVAGYIEMRFEIFDSSGLKDAATFAA